MILKATSPGKLIDLRNRAKWLNLKSDQEDEQELLSALYRVMRIGGRITIQEPNKKKKQVWVFPKE